jgi:tRNA/tmRNA/rRNA uracil-C5-methylase (TrmA/RlmC/RlmD family)
MELEVRIERLGAQGDGVAQVPDGALFVPFTLPGEVVKVAAEPGEHGAEVLAIIEPSPERVTRSASISAPAAPVPSSTWRQKAISPGSASR